MRSRRSPIQARRRTGNDSGIVSQSALTVVRFEDEIESGWLLDQDIARLGRVSATLQAAAAGMGVDCHTTICQPFAPLIQTLV